MTEKYAILIVDDHASNRVALRALLSRLPDCEVLEADSGEAALLSTVSQTIHLILLDVQMPGMDGFETARHLQMTERTRYIPIIFVTAVFKADEFASLGFEAGAVDYLAKPIDDNLLLSRVRLYQHLHEREKNLEAAIQLLIENEKSLSRAKEVAEAMAQELAANALKLRKLNQATEQSPNSLFITDTSGIIEYVNPKFVEDTGYTAAEAIGRTPSLLKSGQTALSTYQELWTTIRSGHVWRGELMNRRKDGTFYWVSASIAPVRDEEGVVSHFVGIDADITEKVQTLENLRDAKEAAERANRAKSVFLANMSHELRTPLNAILGFARLLERDSGLKEESRRKLATINRSGQHLLALINDILGISRIEAGRVEVQLATFSPGQLLNDVEEMIRVRAEDKNLTFEVEHVVELPPYMLGDAHHLKQILINLLGNAVKYTDRGHVRLRVSHGGGQISFEVADTGPGIAKEDQEKIFQAFYQTAGGIAKGEGTGLGLAISHEYARLMAGELSVESQTGQGSIFTLSVPLVATPAPPEGYSVSHGPVLKLEAEEGRPRILVVDDKADNRELVRQILEMVGIDVHTANDGQEALEAFMSWQPQLILMDLRMPVMDGYEATRRIRTLPGGREVKIVAITAAVFEEDHAAVLAAGCDGIVKKPVEEERLFEVLGELLGLRYRYGERPIGVAPYLAAEIDLSGLPMGMVQQLATAAEAVDLERAREIVNQIRQTHPEVGAMLGDSLSEFRFDRISALCKRSDGTYPANDRIVEDAEKP